MGWLQNIFKTKEKPKGKKFDSLVSMRGAEPHFNNFGTEALYSDLVLSAIHMKQRYFGKLDPRHIRNKDGKDQIITDSSVAKVLRSPNYFQTTYDFLTQAYFMREVSGNCFIFPDYYTTNAGQRVFTAMYILLPSEAPHVFEDEKGILYVSFKFDNPEREVVFRWDDLIVWKKDIEDRQFLGGGKYAKGATSDLIESLSAYRQIMQSTAESAKQALIFDGILQVQAYAADNSRVKDIRDQFIKDLRENKGGIAVLDSGAEYKEVQRKLALVDAATLSEIKQNVLVHTGVSIEMLEGKMTTQDKEAFYENFIEPDAISLGQAMTKFFFSRTAESFGNCVLLYPNKIQLMATSEIVSIIQATSASGVFSVDEIRGMLGFAPLENGEGALRPRGYNNLDGKGEPINEGTGAEALGGSNNETE